jgi:hypothetical protein
MQMCFFHRAVLVDIPLLIACMNRGEQTRVTDERAPAPLKLLGIVESIICSASEIHDSGNHNDAA